MTDITVLVVDDSATVRRLLQAMLDDQPGIRCVGTAANPIEARQMIRQLNPDVLTLDVEMPYMNGIDFLRQLMASRPMPVVMISTLTERGADTTWTALSLGAVDFVTKPRFDLGQSLPAAAREIARKVRGAASARIIRTTSAPAVPAAGARAPAAAPRAMGKQDKPAGVARPLSRRIGPDHILAIGASTGGTEAIRQLLAALPAACPPVLIVQHMPAGFTRSFASRLDSLSALDVREAVDGESLQRGRAYLAPGGKHMRLVARATQRVLRLDEQTEVNGHRPSVDVLFDSVAEVIGAQAVGVILTGMGKDGAKGLLRMREKGAATLGQDQASCVVYGMPREAAAVGGVELVLPLGDIGPTLARAISGF